MPDFAELINTPPMDPLDNRFFFGLNFVNVVSDGDTLANPTATVDAAGIAAGVTLSNVQLTETTKIVFKAAVSPGQQDNDRWSGAAKDMWWQSQSKTRQVTRSSAADCCGSPNGKEHS